jgi:hypothetical protein
VVSLAPVPYCKPPSRPQYGASLSGKGTDVEIVEPSADEPIQHSHGGPRHVFTAVRAVPGRLRNL